MGEVVQLEIFTVSTVDPPWRDNKDAMEYPFLSLQKGRTKPIKFRQRNIAISVACARRIWPRVDLGLGLDYLCRVASERRHRGRVVAVATNTICSV